MIPFRSGKPLVAVSADRVMAGPHPSHSAGEKYIDAVVDGAGALALVLPALGARQSVDDLLDTIDGLLLTGSYSNVEPQRYAGPASTPGTLHDVARDATTLPLIRAAIDAGVPVLALCRGLQELNVAFGGTLHARVHEVPARFDHREDKAAPLDAQYGPAHAIHIVPGGLLARITGGATEAQVNSLHAQGIDRLGDGLVIEAVAPDGLIEAIGVRDAPGFVLGVQWHPEWQYVKHPLSQAIFAAFGEACRARRRTAAAQAARASVRT
ncbi:gamma-glutamyl-gamma-aminobutyrate hydrolase family protein [Burkholderia sp. 22PA0099]|uniref:gamma-glutamyl-gamma-aminobutyrate hydrolase family protein n=1 Tax=Burkholderia sp. 22PA0099 TaxID=3237372 RepID=UPI0039C4B4C5